MSTKNLPTVFVPHGAGPCFFMTWNPADTWSAMETWLRNLVALTGTRPKAIIVISAHWEADTFTVNAQPRPGLLYDYYGFPEHTYRITWSAPGSPELATQIRDRLSAAGIAPAEEQHRGLDHGVFIPMKLAFPEADVPVVQLSLRTGLDPAEHLAMEAALAPLRQQGVLIIGSGMSYHNMDHLRTGGANIDPESRRFDHWLRETVTLPRAERETRFAEWAQAPGGRASHPREEHLLPLLVIAGAAGDDPGRPVFEDQVLGSVQSAFLFGSPASTGD